MMTFFHSSFRRFTNFWWGDRGLSAFLFLLFVSLFLRPAIESPLLKLASSVFFSLLLISGVLNVSSRPLPGALTAVVAIAAITLRWGESLAPGPAVAVWSKATACLFLALLTLVLLVRVFRDNTQVTAHRIRGAVAVYLLFGLTFSLLYQLFDLSVPGTFARSAGVPPDPETVQEDLTYFSFVTLTTLGYGDVTAVHPMARMFVVLEALVGQLYPATLLARLVSLEQSTGRERSGEPWRGGEGGR